MASCEKCWSDAGGDPSQYEQLIKERQCTPEEQAGEGAEECPVCKRKTMHIYCHICMACGYKESNTTRGSNGN